MNTRNQPNNEKTKAKQLERVHPRETNDMGDQSRGRPDNHSQVGGSNPPLVDNQDTYFALVKEGKPIIMTANAREHDPGCKFVAVFQDRGMAMAWLTQFKADTQTQQQRTHQHAQHNDMSMVNSVNTRRINNNSNGWRSMTPLQRQVQRETQRKLRNIATQIIQQGMPQTHQQLTTTRMQ